MAAIHEERKDHHDFEYISLTVADVDGFKQEINKRWQEPHRPLARTEYHVTLFHKSNKEIDLSRILHIFGEKRFNLNLLAIYIVTSSPTDIIAFVEVEIDTEDEETKKLFYECTNDASHITLFTRGKEANQNSGIYLKAIKNGGFEKNFVKMPLDPPIQIVSEYRKVTSKMQTLDTVNTDYYELIHTIQENIDAIKSNNEKFDKYSDALRPLFLPKYTDSNAKLNFSEIDYELGFIANPEGTKKKEQNVIDEMKKKLEDGSMNEKAKHGIEKRISGLEENRKKYPCLEEIIKELNTNSAQIAALRANINDIKSLEGRKEKAMIGMSKGGYYDKYTRSKSEYNRLKY